MAGMTPGTPRVLRAMNDRAALDLLLEQGPLSRGRIGKLTGLSKPTASQLLSRLEAAGLVVVTGRSEGLPGPNAQLYAVNGEAAHVAGVDVTTARILAGVADIAGRLVGTFELPTPPPTTRPGHRQQGAAGLVLQAVEGAAKAAGVHRTDLHRVVIGTPGAFDPSTGRLRYASHLPGWHSPSLLEELAAALPMPLEYDNDVNLVAVAEQRLGVAGGYEDFVLLWNEEGIGAALVIGGKLHRGRTGGAGEVGFLPVPGTPLVRDPEHLNSGGFQALAGANAVLRWAHELRLPYEQEAALHDKAAGLIARAVVAAEGENEDGPHGELLRRFATGTAVGLASMVAVLDPQLIVLSGGVLAAGGEPLREMVRAELTELAVPRPPLMLGTVTGAAVLHGALESALATTRDEVFDTTR
ncbi:ROK family transcriptional regulator [Streptomyces albidus (ex Kaewkla and Franco 2022)]|uniref:ROK family transcriptional regulator n=1 Tax=Streptomyces albidus (ex Kaewkla and Franco 2022) TaxID=722709 RepID=UPI0015EF92C0|nr:ROK family transcriptional regulator [Streptomyces albidus (ex Kaewkla and Franco 2022)]